MKSDFDILIIGAGIAGCISAMFLHPHYSVYVVDKENQPAFPCYESLVASSKRIFKELDILDEILSLDQSVISSSVGIKSYWATKSPQYTDSIKNPEGEGLLVHKLAFVEALRKITNKKGISINGSRILNVQSQPSGWKITMKDSESTREISAKYIIDASGRANFFRNKEQLTKENLDQLVCANAILQTDALQRVSIIYPNKTGWFYVSPMPNQQFYVSYYTDSDLWDKASLVGEEFVLQRLKDTPFLAEELGLSGMTHYRNVGIKAAHSSTLSHVVGENWLALGDAAMTLDPLSSAGSYNSMRSAAHLSKLLIDRNFLKTASSHENQTFQQQVYDYYSKVWRQYTQEHLYYYSMEDRWNEQLFWARRSSVFG